ncbi:MAG: serine hydroxymethyltransferase [Acidiferrobacterales bacterium]
MNEPHHGYFTASLAEADPELAEALSNELRRQQDQIELIASENLVSRAVLEAQGSVFTNKTVEGYIGRRYHGGADYADIIEGLAVERAKVLFGCSYANVQPHSGSQANQVVYVAFLRPGDTILSMALAAGGHLSHGAAPNLSGKWFNVVQYGVSEQTGLLDYDAAEALATELRPKLVIAGGSAYPRTIDFARFREIADRAGALLLVDMAHFAGLVAGGAHPSPLADADIVTTTTYKSLRGARGGIILSNDNDLGKKVDAALFPGLQGSPILHAVAAKATCLGEALKPEFREYARKVVDNARMLAATLTERGYTLVTGGTDTALMLVDLRPQELTGKASSASLEAAGLTCNKNSIPGDAQSPMVTSGLRLSTSAGTTRGFDTVEFKQIGEWIADVLDALASNREDNSAVEGAIRQQVSELCQQFPIYFRL